MRVIVTRPEREAGRWVDALRARGFDAIALSLIDIQPAADPAPMRAAWQDLPGCRAAMFVSANAVAHFFEQAGGSGSWPAGVRAWAPGPGTRATLLAAGLAPECVNAPAPDAGQFDSEALWLQVRSQVRPGDRVLVVRGGDAHGVAAGRDWLRDQIAQAGASVDTVESYLRRCPRLDAGQEELARRAAADGSVWLFSSSEAINNLQALLPGQGWGEARAVATHPRIAQAARDAGFGVVCPSRPTLDDMVASIESFR